MTERDDITLLREFAATDSEAAFAALVQRHINLVYSTALRSVGSAHAAEEISQAVFIILAHKAKSLGAKTILAGWLHQTTRLTAANFLRGEIRRQKREQEAYMQSALNESDVSVWPQIAPLLDDALGKLGERDRNALVLRFLENKSLAEVGAALGASEDAAKMRVNRALEKLRKLFGQRGVALSATLIAGAVSAGSVQAAPAGLAATISTVAITKGAAAGGSTLTLVKGALKIMAWTKMKTAILVGLGVLLVAGTTTVTIREIAAHRDEMWQKRWDVTMVDKVPPQVKILPALSSRSAKVNIGITTTSGKEIGLGCDFGDLLIMAYHFSKSQMVFSTAVPKGRYDFISNLPKGQDEALQREIQKTFGVIVRREMIETNVLNLTVRSGHADGLRHSNARSRTTFSEGPGSLICHGQMIYTFVDYLTRSLGTPVIDKTGLKDDLDIDLNWGSTPEGFKLAMRDQLGLELVPSREPVEMLVVEKAK